MDSKEYFRIGELSHLYNIGLDSIRYYEKMGVLKPVRDPHNNYRLYSLKDIRKTTTIRELLDLNFSMEQIRDFENHRDLNHSFHLLEEELDVINESIKKLIKTKQSIQTRLSSIRHALLLQKQKGIRIAHFPERYCIMISDTNLPDAYVDYAIIKYTKNHPESSINTIGSCDCYTLDLANSNPKSTLYRTKNVFYYSEGLKGQHNYVLPEGTYLCVTYTGSYDYTKKWVPKMLDYAKKHDMEVLSDPMEFCYVNEYETANENEYITDVQIQVSST